MKSYEASKWYVKLWRKRWYFLIPFIFFKRNLLNTKLIEMIFEGATKDDRAKMINSWFDIKKSIELTKMHKYS